ncbi:MAG: ion channel [Pseudomonadota bacterium]
MVAQLLVGSALISASIVIEAVFVGAAWVTLGRIGPWLGTPVRAPRVILMLVVTTLWMMAAHGLSVWVWALAFLWLDIFHELEPALYFSVVAFTTLGFGDVLLPQEWRLLAGLSAANGLLIFGVSTAFLVEVFRRVGDDNFTR